MDITWTTHDFGRAGELDKLNRDRNNPAIHPFQRRMADEAHAKISKQLKDIKLMGLRERLIKAARAGDLIEQDKIGRQMKDYLGEDKETGL